MEFPALYVNAIYANQGDGKGIEFNHSDITTTECCDFIYGSANIIVNGVPVTVP